MTNQNKLDAFSSSNTFFMKLVEIGYLKAFTN